ncbi:MAG: hypothetical protein ACK5UE_06390 [Chitinophagales bacterium]|jgi:hypothetical protein|nr:hypothetical protein [Sphingobacteriales bacterium]
MQNNYTKLSDQTIILYRDRLDEHLSLIDKTKSARAIEWIIGSLEFANYVLSELVIQSEEAILLASQYESTLALFKKRLSDEETFRSTSERKYNKIGDSKYASTVRHKRPIVKIK